MKRSIACNAGSSCPLVEREGVADVLRAPRAPDPGGHRILRVLRHIVIDHVTHAGDVQPARCDIGRDHHFVFAALEALERLDPFPLSVRLECNTATACLPCFNWCAIRSAPYLVLQKNQRAVEIRPLGRKPLAESEFLFSGNGINRVGDCFRRRAAHANLH